MGGPFKLTRRSGKAATPLSGFWALGSVEGALDPAVPNLPLLTAAPAAFSTLRSNGVDQADADTYSEVSQETGAAGALRYVLIWGRKNSAGSGLPATCSIGGEALTRIDASSIENNVGATNPKMSACWFVGSPSVGGSQTVAFTFTDDGTSGGAAATMIRAGWAVYEADGYSSTVYDAVTNGASAEGDTTLSGTIDVPEGGGLLAFGVISDTVAGGSLTGVGTEDIDALDGSGNAAQLGGHEDGLSAETGRTVGVSFNPDAGYIGDDAVFTAISLSLASAGQQASVKVAGAWKTLSAIGVKVSGAWKTVSAAHVKVAGAWKRAF